MTIPHYFIAVAGNIGAGKSTLTERLAQRLGWQPFYEAHAQNPYLADFYADMTRWSFHSQIFFLGKRLEHHRQLVNYPTSVIQDRTVYEDAEIFARNLYEQGHMSPRDYATYRQLYEAVTAFLPAPHLLIYLAADVETLQHHIQQRGRSFEQQISAEYLATLNRLYEQWISDWTACDVLHLNMNHLSFQQHPDHLDHIIQQIQMRLPLMTP